MSKLDSDLTEALYTLSLDGTDEYTGDVDFRGHFSLITLKSDVTVDLPYGGTVTVPAGTYVISEDSQGFVDSTDFEELSDAQDFFDYEDELYGEYLEAVSYDGPTEEV